jgi:PAS domain S-box-containing protein
LSALQDENRLLRQENERLRRQTEGVAQANAHAAELMVRLEETNNTLEGEVERRRQVEDELRRANSEMDARVQARTVELTAANDRLAREVEERKQIEHTLRESKNRLDTVLNAMLMGVLIVDSQTHQIVDVNPHAVQIIRLPKDQIVGRVCHHFVCPAENGSCPISDLGQTVDRSERFLLRADGSRVPILKTVVSSTWQGREYLIESFVDISRLKQVEEEVKESLSLLEATLDATADGILVVDLAGKIKGFNRQYQRLWGIPDAVLQNRNNEEAAAVAMQQVKDPDAFQAIRRKSGANVEVERFDTLELKDGRILERYSRPQVLGNRVVGQVLSFRDVTERHLAEQKREALLRKVADINEELSHFAYVVSHDLKAPLRGIKLVTEWLCEDYGDKLDAEAKEQMTLLQSRVNRMHNLIDGVLQYSRVGRIKEEMVEVNLNELLPMVLDDIAPPAHIHVTVQSDLPTLTGEKTRITQVFQNLLSNAVKFMDKPQGEIHVRCVAAAEFWKFGVTDNGPGIEEKHFERIFRIFQTLAPKDEYESTGVGLTLVKKIVELYGGRVWVESEVGRGSTFFFTFPQRQVEAHHACVGTLDQSDDSVASRAREGSGPEA